MHALLTEEELTQHMDHLPGWTRDGGSLIKEYHFKRFSQSLQFVNHIAETADAVNHHPDIDIRYDKVRLVLSTHDAGGVTQSDVEMAASADDSADAIAA
jgi:4a-hydroxytetrahydrobiopterin dehydratase